MAPRTKPFLETGATVIGTGVGESFEMEVTGAAVGWEVAGATVIGTGVGESFEMEVTGAAVGWEVAGATVIDISITIDMLWNWSQSVWSLQKAGNLY
jgi:hypothetical protein